MHVPPPDQAPGAPDASEHAAAGGKRRHDATVDAPPSAPAGRDAGPRVVLPVAFAHSYTYFLNVAVGALPFPRFGRAAELWLSELARDVCGDELDHVSALVGLSRVCLAPSPRWPRCSGVLPVCLPVCCRVR